MIVRYVFAALSTLTVAASSGSWLDSAAPKNWNVAGAAIPQAPALKSEEPRVGRCNVRPSFAAEDRAVIAKGWTLIGPYERYGKTAIVFAEAGHSPQCLPASYQGFAFYDGRFAGTLSPTLMDETAEGSLNIYAPAGFSGENGFQVSYARRVAGDAGCCPSMKTIVRFRIAPGASGPTLSVQETYTPKKSQ